MSTPDNSSLHHNCTYLKFSSKQPWRIFSSAWINTSNPIFESFYLPMDFWLLKEKPTTSRLILTRYFTLIVSVISLSNKHMYLEICQKWMKRKILDYTACKPVMIERNRKCHPINAQRNLIILSLSKLVWQLSVLQLIVARRELGCEQ